MEKKPPISTIPPMNDAASNPAHASSPASCCVAFSVVDDVDGGVVLLVLVTSLAEDAGLFVLGVSVNIHKNSTI